MINEGENVFVNSAINEGMQLFIANKNKDNLDYNCFLCSIIRMLVLLYDENRLIEAYYQKNEEAFDTIVMEYGYTKEEVSYFKMVCEKFYHFDKKQKNKSIKKKNKYFNLVQKCLIDMFIKKNGVQKLEDEIMKNFYQLLFTARSKDFYRKSTAVLLAYNPYEIDDYAKKQNLIGGL